MDFSSLAILVTNVFTLKIAYSCPPIQPPPYGSLIRPCGTQVDDNCYIDCEPGFDIIGSCYRLCLKDNVTWSGTDTQCINPSISCKPLTPPENGEFVDGCQYYAGVVCESRCKTGYMLVGKQKILCQKNGTWSEKVPRCELSGCPTLNAPTNGGMTTGTCGTSVATVCSFFCNAGFRLIGNTQIECLATKTWSANVPICIKNDFCPKISAPQNSHFKEKCSMPAQIGEKCTIACNTGYLLFGSSTITCEESVAWSKLPVCNPNSCPALNPPVHGYISGQCSPGIPGFSCIYSCYPGFVIEGQATLLCLTSLIWSAPSPKCTPTGCTSLAPYIPANGYFTGHCNPGMIGQSCTVVCNEGYRILGSPSIQCGADKQWSGPVPQCQLNGCGTLGAPKGGLFINKCIGCPNSCFGKPGQKCTLVCGEGYSMIGTGDTVCQEVSLEWKPDPSTCKEIAWRSKQGSSAVCKPGTSDCDTSFRDVAKTKMNSKQSTETRIKNKKNRKS